jgi:hypothetical protein
MLDSEIATKVRAFFKEHNISSEAALDELNDRGEGIEFVTLLNDIGKEGEFIEEELDEEEDDE